MSVSAFSKSSFIFEVELGSYSRFREDHKAAWVEIRGGREIEGRSRGGMNRDQRGERLREDQRRHG